MKSTRPLAAAITASLFLVQSVIGASPTSKKSAKSAEKPAKAAAAATPAPVGEAEKAGASPEAMPAPMSPAEEAQPGAAPAPDPALPEVVATVDGQEIKREELQRTFDGFLASRQIPAEALPPEQKAEGYRMILSEMVKEKIIENRAKDIVVSDQEVTDTFKKFTSSMGPEEEVKKQIEANGQTIEKIRENIRSSLKQEKWLDAEIAKSGGATAKDAEEFYKKNPDQFVTPPQVRASHVLIKVESEAKPEVVAEKKKAAEAVAARARKGEDFGKLASELSEDPSAKQNAGDLDFFTKERMVPEFANAAFEMKKGDISDPVRSQFGFHVIKVTDTKTGGKVEFATASDKIVNYLKSQKAEEIKQKLLATAKVTMNLPPAPTPAAVPMPDVAPAAPVPAPPATSTPGGTPSASASPAPAAP